MTRAKGYGITNYRIHRLLEQMSVKERKSFELKLKKNNEKKYNGFKEWQKDFMKIIPEHKIDY
ncbi:hypothetical protein [Methanobrevibacter sp.]|uniref:hypothetical protein n=1 Tax=Methanobrevibacter sp. TaxID=66852 RepID=UPI0038659DC1